MKLQKSKLKFYIIATILFNINSYSQYKFQIPDGFELVKDKKNKLNRIDKDFDKDGFKDTFIIMRDKNKKNYLGKKIGGNVVANFSSNKEDGNNFSYIPIDAPRYSFEIKKDVIWIYCGMNDWSMFKLFKFRFNSELNDYELIGFDESLDAKNEQGRNKSLNFINSTYTISTNQGQIIKIDSFELPNITMGNIDEITLDNFISVGGEYMTD